jgi:hypothetical protein
MGKTTASLQCPQCARDFSVELNEMRSNYPNRCPSCGAGCMISSDEAIRAHRLLERIECANRTPGPIGPWVPFLGLSA